MTRPPAAPVRVRSRAAPNSPTRPADRDAPRQDARGPQRHAPQQQPAHQPQFQQQRPVPPLDRRDERQDNRRAGQGPQHPPRPLPQPASGAATVAAADGVRLSKVLAERGIASRREADEWIEAGWVRVNGQPAVLGQRVPPDVAIDIDPAARTEQAQRVTILLHKPIGYVSGQAEDGHEPASVLVVGANRWAEDKVATRFHPGQQRGLAPAGRLDIDSTGLLVLTQDGRVAKQLIGEDSQVEKEYLVRVVPHPDGGWAPERLSLLQNGLELDGRRLKPARVSWANEDQLRFVLREGRKRQIRRMCELVGLQVTGLKRVRIGSVVLGKLPAGQWRYLRPDERF
jgi:23S rRNA pseudouridine2604 synthase